MPNLLIKEVMFFEVLLLSSYCLLFVVLSHCGITANRTQSSELDRNDSKKTKNNNNNNNKILIIKLHKRCDESVNHDK